MLMLIAALFMIVKRYKKQTKCPSMYEWIHRMYYSTDNGMLFSLKGNSDTCYNTDEPWGHYAKQNKPDMKGWLCMIHSIYMQFQKWPIH